MTPPAADPPPFGAAAPPGPPALPPPLFFPPLPGACTLSVDAAPAASSFGRTLSASLGTKTSASATQRATTTSAATTLAPVGPMTDRAVSEPSAYFGAALVRAVTENEWRTGRRNSVGRATVSLAGTRIVLAGGTMYGPRARSTTVLFGARASRFTASGCCPVFCRTTNSRRLCTARLSGGSRVSVTWPGALTTRSTPWTVVLPCRTPVAGSSACTASASG